MRRAILYTVVMLVLPCAGWFFAITVAFYDCGEHDVVLEHPRYGRFCDDVNLVGQHFVMVVLALVLAAISLGPLLLRSPRARARTMVAGPVVALLLIVATMQIPDLLGV